MTLNLGSSSLQLHPVGFELFRLLIEYAPNPVKTSLIQHTLWQDKMPDSDPLRANVYKLRKQCLQHLGQSLIATVKGVGYQLSVESEATKPSEGDK